MLYREFRLEVPLEGKLEYFRLDFNVKVERALRYGPLKRLEPVEDPDCDLEAWAEWCSEVSLLIESMWSYTREMGFEAFATWEEWEEWKEEIINMIRAI